MTKPNSPGWPQVCFLHLAKTAGSSLNKLLGDRFIDHSGIGIVPEDMDQMPIGALQEKGLVSAHFSIRHLTLLNNHRFLFTFLRDPVDRVISNYYYLHAYDGPATETNSAVLASAKNKSFHNFLLDDHPQVRSFTNNMQANALAWDWRGPCRQNLRQLDQIAIGALTQFDFIGFFEHYNESLQALFRELHWHIEPGEEEVVVNKTQLRPLVSQIEPRTLSLVKELNWADQQLYDFAWAQTHTTEAPIEFSRLVG